MYSITKRLFDLASSVVGLTLFSPLMIIIVILIFIDDPGPVIFKQKRVGKNNELFTIYKFRSMKLNTPDVATHLLTDSKMYITRIGRLIRKTSIDELPQLWNIIKGNMSVVGPRPALYNQYDLINLREENKIHLLKPGITGLAQINGRDEISIRQKVDFDMQYNQNKSIILDIKIILRTIVKVMKSSGVSEGKNEEE